MKRNLPFSPEEFKDIYSKVPRLCVDLIIKNKKGVLLTLRQKNGYKGQWHLPGGTVFYRESVEDAVKRISKVELGVDVIINSFFGYLEYFSEIKERGFGYSVSLVFLCKAKASNFVLDNNADKIEFFKITPSNTIQEQKDLLEKLQAKL